jgi:hypothetical protein
MDWAKLVLFPTTPAFRSMVDMNIKYKVNTPVTTEQFTELLRTSTLGERRPVEDHACMEGMVKNANLMVTAWDSEKLVGIARSVTDFSYACYLSDLAVKYQRCWVLDREQRIRS